MLSRYTNTKITKKKKGSVRIYFTITNLIYILFYLYRLHSMQTHFFLLNKLNLDRNSFEIL